MQKEADDHRRQNEKAVSHWRKTNGSQDKHKSLGHPW